MSKLTPSSVTAEEAVARMVNMDYIPEGFTLEDMLSAFREEADVELYNAKIDHLPDIQIESLKVRLDACDARLSLAQMLLKDLENEARKEISMIILSKDSSSKPRYTLESIAEWVAYNYGIGIPEWSTDCVYPSTAKKAPIGVTWEDIEIRIRKDNKIAYSHEKGKWTEKTFAKINLLDRKTQKPNDQGDILIDLSVDKKYPNSRTILGMHKTAVSRLRSSLKLLTGIKSDPFVRFNETDGYKPRFKLTDHRKNADERAKMAAVHEEFDDGKNYEDEDDAGGKWLNGDR